MNKSGNHYDQENLDPNIRITHHSYKKQYRSSAKSMDPWSANTGEVSHTTNNDDVEISCFQVGPQKQTQLTSNQAAVAQVHIEQFLTSNNVPDIFSYLDEFEDLDWVRPSQIIHLIELIAKQKKENIKERIVGLTCILTSKQYILTRQVIKMIFNVSCRIGSEDGLYALHRIDDALVNMIEQFEANEQLRVFNQGQFLPLILYSHAHQLLYWNLVAECWDLLKSKIANAILSEEWHKTTQKICDMLIRHIIEQCSQDESWAQLLQEILTLGVLQIRATDIFFNKLIDFAFKHKQVVIAEILFTFMRDQAKVNPTIVTINTMIDQYFKNNMKEQAWHTFELLKESQIRPDNFTYTTLINGLKNNRDGLDLKLAFTLFDEYKEFNAPDQIIYNCLLDACINAGDLHRAFLLLQEMKNTKSIQLDEITYNTLIKGCGRKKRLGDAIGLFEEMKQMGIRPNRISFNSLLDSCVKCNKMSTAWKYFEEMRKQHGIFPDNFTYSILVNGIKTNHSNRDELLRAISLLDQIQETGQFKPDEILYNSLIDACVKFNEITKALQLFAEMKHKQIEPSSVTYGILIKAHGKMNDLNGAFQIFLEMKQKSIPINDVTYGCLVDACVRNDRLDRALQIIEEMKQIGVPINTVLYTTLIKGYCKLNQTEEAMKNFEQMKQSQRTYPNLITYNSLLDGLVKNNQLYDADQLFQELLKSHIKPDLITFSTLLKGHCRRGNMKKVNEAVHTMINQQITPDESLLQLILESCLQWQQQSVGVQIYDQFCHHIPTSTQLLLTSIRIHSCANELRQAIPLLDRLLALLEENRIQHHQLECTLNGLLNSQLDESTYGVITRIIIIGMRMDYNLHSLDSLIVADNCELIELLQQTSRVSCTRLQQVMSDLDSESQQACRQYLKRNSKNDQKEPLNEQFGQVFLSSCNKQASNKYSPSTKYIKQSPANNENKENVYKKQHNHNNNDLHAYISRKHC